MSLAIGVALLSLAGVGAAGASPETKPVTVVAAGDVIDRATVSGQVDRYALDLEAGQFVHAVVDQRNVADVLVSVEDPLGRVGIPFEGPSSTVSPVAFVASNGGRHVLVAHTRSAGDGARYGLRIEAVRAPGPSDLLLVRTARAMSEAGRVFGTDEAHGRGMALWQESLDGWRALGNRTMEMWTEIQMGSLYRTHFEEYRESRAPLLRGLAIARELGDERAQTTTLFNLGSSSWRLAEFDAARKYFEEDLELHRAAGRIASVAFLLTALGRMHTAAGELQPALDRLHEALEIYREHPAETAPEPDEPDPVALARSYLGGAYAALGDDELALAEFQKARELIAPPETLKDRPEVALHFVSQRARMTTGIGSALLGLGDLEGARRAASEALAGYRQMAHAVHEAEARLLLADIHREEGHLEAARSELQAAIDVLRPRGVRMTEALARCRLGEVERRLGNREAARAAFEEARATPGLASVVLTACAEEGLARLALDHGDPRAAAPYAESAIRAAESLRASAGGPQARAAAMASRQTLYELLVEVRMRLHASEPAAGHDAAALAASEQARARSLLDLLSEGTLDVREGVDETLLASERSLRQRLNAQAEALQQAMAEGRGERAAALEQEITSICAELGEVEARIRRASPRYASLTQPRPSTVEEIKADLLEEGTLLLEYALGEKASYLWVVSASRVRSYVLPARATIEAAARRAYEGFTTPARGGRDLRAAPAGAAAELSRLLLAPAAEALGRQRLLIVAPGLLQYVPFGALPDPRKAQALLLARHEIVTASSASVVAATRREAVERAPSTVRVAVLADPVYERDDPRLAANRRGPMPADASDRPLTRALRGLGGRNGLTRLPFSRREANVIASLLPAGQVRKAIGFEATRDLAVSSDIGRASVLHFATHGVLDTQHPELSGVVLSLLDENGNPRDGFLRLHDVYNLRLAADLVVLSGCQTALGKDVRGEGLVGLTRGFLYAGARRVMASLWQVDDRATSELMARFYRALLKDGSSPAAALREAQLSLSRSPQWRDPYNWAGFVIQGDL